MNLVGMSEGKKPIARGDESGGLLLGLGVGVFGNG